MMQNFRSSRAVRTRAVRPAALLGSLLVALLGWSAGARAADPGSGTGGASIAINLSGTVPVLCSFTYAASASAGQLNLVTGQPNGLQVATVTETCNNRNGYVVTVASSNRGLVLAEAPQAPTVYQMGYADQYQASNGGPLRVSRPGPQFNLAVPLMVRFEANPQALNGTYVDTLLVTIAAN